MEAQRNTAIGQKNFMEREKQDAIKELEKAFNELDETSGRLQGVEAELEKTCEQLLAVQVDKIPD